MWVGSNSFRVRGRNLCGWAVLAAAAIVITGCSSSRNERADIAEADKRRAEAGEESVGVLAAFEAWASDSGAGGEDSGTRASARQPGGAGASPDGTGLDAVIEQFNRKVSACWKQPFAMPRLATVRLLVHFNPDGTVRNVEPRPEVSEAQRYRTETPYLVMIAHTSQALRQCQPYAGIRENYTRLSQLEMVVDPRMFRD